MARQFLDCDGDTWTEVTPGELRLTAVGPNTESWHVGMEETIEVARDDHGPLTEIRPDADKLDPARLERTLRAYIAELDYDHHKSIQCGEDDGVDRYPDEVAFFLRCWEAAK
ncbi:hypothetical protein [Streptomyces sp. NPDC056061]|uniref:hypothetical protein n=1 Tax=Streptomyces sp. NPDC056061 TaxID=3345700 RepID=UPI0035DD0BF1